MKLRDCLEKLLIKDGLSGVDENKITLEGGHKKSAYPVELIGVDAIGEDTNEVSVINLGKGPHSSLICPKSEYKKICDYLILIPGEKNRVEALFLELKATWKGKGKDQLYASIPFLDYIQSMIRHHFDKNYIFTHTFFLIANKDAERLAKGRVRPKPERMTSFEIKNNKKMDVKLIFSDVIPFKQFGTINKQR